MIAEIYDHLLASYAAILGVNTMQAFPVLARPDMTLPLVALELLTGRPSYSRVGQTWANYEVGFRGWLFARDETELCNLTDGLLAWHETDGRAFDIAARRVDCGLQGLDRWVAETSSLLEAHAITFMVAVNY